MYNLILYIYITTNIAIHLYISTVKSIVFISREEVFKTNNETTHLHVYNIHILHIPTHIYETIVFY